MHLQGVKRVSLEAESTEQVDEPPVGLERARPDLPARVTPRICQLLGGLREYGLLKDPGAAQVRPDLHDHAVGLLQPREAE